MARNFHKTSPASKTSRPSSAPKIHLTLSQSHTGQLAVGVSLTEFIAYSSAPGFTRLRLTGGKELEVKETTDQIDRLVREVSRQGYSSAAAAIPEIKPDVGSGAS
jgi:hypothetical protein